MTSGGPSGVRAPAPRRVSAAGLAQALRQLGGVLVLVVLPLAVVGAYLLVGIRVIWLDGPPVFDFQSFWVAARMALEGRAGDAYDAALHAAEQVRLHANAAVHTADFVYPPFFLLVCLPFGMLPYATAAALWVTTGALAWIAALRAMVPGWTIVLVLAAFPAVNWNIRYGQNGFLTAALFAVMAHNLGPRPVVAGLSIGLLAYKPHLGVVLPFALLLGGHGVAFVAATLTVVATAALATIVLGTGIWAPFLAAGAGMTGRLSWPESYLRQLATVFGALRLMGADQATAYAGQAVVALGAVASLVAAIRRRPDAAAQVAAMVSCTALCTPHLLRYDLMMLTIPMAWLWVAAKASGWRVGERAALAVAFVVVAEGMVTLGTTQVLLTPIAAMVIHAAVVRRILVPAGAGPRTAPC